MSLSFSKFSDESSLDFGYDRKRHPKRSNSFDSYYAIPQFFKSPLLDHQLSHHEVERVNYRTAAAFKWGREGKYNFSPIVQYSSDHQYDNHLRRWCSRFDGDSSDESTILDETDSETAHTAEPERSSEEALCERCRNINIENLTEEHGYTHSTLYVLKRSVASCPLCRTFFDIVIDKDINWTIERYRMILSLSFPRETIFSGRHSAPLLLHKCVWVSVIDTRPWEPPEGHVKDHFVMQNAPYKLSQGERSLFDIRITCYTQEDDAAVRMGVPWLRKINGHTGSPVALRVAKGWFDECIAAENLEEDFGDVEPGDESPQTSLAHPMQNMETTSLNMRDFQVWKSEQRTNDTTRMNSDTQLAASPFPAERPSRLVEIVRYSDTQPSDRIVRLVKTNGQDYAYAALSYCWGSSGGSWLTTKETIDESFHQINIENLPATLKDALHVTFSLGLKYLWVDALCIVQDSMHDWEIESAMMGGVYRGAQLTLAVSKSSSGSEGCFNQDQNPQHNPFGDYICVGSRLKNNGVSRLYFEKLAVPWKVFPSSGSFQAEVYESPLALRAWTYQEQILSRRTLFFARSQLYWECDHCRLSLDNSQQAQHERAYPVLTFSQPMSTGEAIDKWYRDAVEVYSRRKLTNPTDRLVAISAIAKATFFNRHVNYIAGLWEDCIFAGLCWYRYGAGKKSRFFSCPSWSWASQESGISYSAIRFYFTEPNNSFTSPNVLDIQIQTSDNNPFGDVAIGRITLHTRATRGIVMRDNFGRSDFSFGFGYVHSSGKKALLIPEANSWNIWHGIAIMDDDAHKGQAVVVALVSDWNAESRKWLMILLEPTEEGEQEYRRVGLAVLEWSIGVLNGNRAMPNVERDWAKRTITIL